MLISIQNVNFSFKSKKLPQFWIFLKIFPNPMESITVAKSFWTSSNSSRPSSIAEMYFLIFELNLKSEKYKIYSHERMCSDPEWWFQIHGSTSIFAYLPAIKWCISAMPTAMLANSNPKWHRSSFQNCRWPIFRRNKKEIKWLCQQKHLAQPLRLKCSYDFPKA